MFDVGDSIVCIKQPRQRDSSFPLPPIHPFLYQVYTAVRFKRHKRVVLVELAEIPGWTWNIRYFRKAEGKPAYEEPRRVEAPKELEPA